MKAILQTGPWMGTTAEIIGKHRLDNGTDVYQCAFEVSTEKHRWTHKQWITESNLELLEE